MDKFGFGDLLKLVFWGAVGLCALNVLGWAVAYILIFSV